ncbi:uncharacterized protein [Dermacentor albipictus]|uniref:uncharacterized protein n=1 Tax=Dermacentor albipictus TaxID=60249 RepID=UPI0031FC7116
MGLPRTDFIWRAPRTDAAIPVVRYARVRCSNGLQSVAGDCTQGNHLTCNVPWEVLSPVYMKPSTEGEWRDVASGFGSCWQFPNCLGAVDGKHVRIRCPRKAGSLYFNYKVLGNPGVTSCELLVPCRPLCGVLVPNISLLFCYLYQAHSEKD